MCHKLLQVYACGHMKTVCLTPCPHAISTGLQSQSDQDPPTYEASLVGSISRSPSVASSIAPSIHESDLQDIFSQRHLSRQPTASLPSQLRAGSNNSGAQEKARPSAALRLVPLGQIRTLSPRPGYSQPSPTSPSAPSASLPSPVASIATQSSKSTPTSPSFSNVLSEDPTIEPNYCAYHFPRYLRQSVRPCLQCYMHPDYENQRALWLKTYRENHLSVKPEDLEETGFERLRGEWNSRQ